MMRHVWSFGVAGLLALTAGASVEAQSCQSVSYYYWDLAQDVDLYCQNPNRPDSDYTIFEVTVPDTGRAVAMVYADFENLSSNPGDNYFWNLGVTVGDAIHDYRLGADVCPATTAQTQRNMGYGQLSASGSQTVRVSAYQGHSNCVDGVLRVPAGARLSVWVEDDLPQCVGETIQYHSYYARNQPAEVLSWWHWPSTMTPVHDVEIAVDGNDNGFIVLTSAEGTPWVNPNDTCGQETATLAAQIVVNGNIEHTAIETIPASGGMGHHVFGDYLAYPVSGAGTHSVQYTLGRNFGGMSNTSTDPGAIVTSGGCCGDAAIALIKY